MNKIIILILFGIFSFLNAKVNIVVSILPQKTFVEAIGKDKVNVSVMVKPGSSPHSYEPKPSQMRDIAKAKVYFSIGVEFENSWLSKFANQNRNMQIRDISKNINKLEIRDHNIIEKDPHIWTSPLNVKIIVQNIYETLVAIDTANKSYYKNNLDQFIKHINSVNKQIIKNLSCTSKGSKFMVFHPAWQYFATQYDLVQLSVELDGKAPKPRALANLIKNARKHNVKAIFTQPEFSPKTANIIANELGIKVVKATPIAPDWSDNLIKFSEALCR